MEEAEAPPAGGPPQQIDHQLSVQLSDLAAARCCAEALGDCPRGGLAHRLAPHSQLLQQGALQLPGHLIFVQDLQAAVASYEAGAQQLP